jgi:hypothetical protein
VDFDELARAEQVAGELALGPERGDGGGQDDEAGVGHQPGHLRDPPDVLDAVGVGEAEVLVQAVPDVVAVEQVGVEALAVQAPFDEVRDG